jgi:CheY-like chemotaxis protein
MAPLVTPAGARARVLVVDDDQSTRDTLSLVLRLRRMEVFTAASGAEAVQHVRSAAVDLVLADLRLPDYSGLELLRLLRRDAILVPFVVITGFGTIRSAVEAMRLGATDYVEKPLDEEDILQIVESSLNPPLRSTTPTWDGSTDAPSIQRWARLIICIVDAKADPRNLTEWGRLVYASRSTLENWCRAAGIHAKASLKFGRLLRAIIQAERLDWRPEDLLDADPRTLRRLMLEGALKSGRGSAEPPGPHVFLTTQRIITDSLAIAAIRTELSRRR